MYNEQHKALIVALPSGELFYLRRYMAEKKGFGKGSLLSWVASKSKKSPEKKMDNKSWKSKVVKKAEKGHDFGKKNKKGTGFKVVEDKAAKEYGSKKAGEKVAGAAFWHKMAK